MEVVDPFLVVVEHYLWWVLFQVAVEHYLFQVVVGLLDLEVVVRFLWKVEAEVDLFLEVVERYL